MLARIPPEQLARMEAAMKAHAAGEHTRRVCLTDKDLERPFRPDTDAESHCSHTVVSRTASSMEMHMECKDKGRLGTTADGTFKWQAPTPESMQGTVEMHMSDGSHTMTHRTRLSGKWLGADCGSVKPRS